MQPAKKRQIYLWLRAGTNEVLIKIRLNYDTGSSEEDLSNIAKKCFCRVEN